MIKKTLKYRTTDKRKASLISGVLLTLILVSTPFLFYLYRIVPSDTAEWDTIFGTVRANGFNTVQGYIYTLFTKLTFVLLTAIWFVTSRNWWKYAVLVPLTMFLFQLSGVVNQNIQYIDEYDFWYSLPVILPIIFFLIFISYRLGKRRAAEAEALKEQVDEEISNIFGDDL